MAIDVRMNLFFSSGCTVLFTVLLFGACSRNSIKPCGVLPDPEACPIGRGGTCLDAECAALYNCLDGAWVLDEVCEQSSVGGAGGGGEGAGGEGGCNGVVVDRTGEANACSPPLQDPDCPAGAAELCRPCETGCLDFFLCRDEGWVSVAFCDEGGNVVVEP